MSGHYDYTSFLKKIPKDINIYNVPIVQANEENIKDYGRFVKDFENEKVINVQWPKEKKLILKDGKYRYTREIDKLTGLEALPTHGVFNSYYDNNYFYSENTSVENGKYIIGVRPENEKDLCFYTSEINLHECGGQVIMNINKEPFLLLLSKADDFIKPQDCILFYFDGTLGFQIYPKIFHQPMYPLVKPLVNVVSKNKQCSVHSCVTVNFLEEFNTLLKINIGFYYRSRL
jgi:ureidoglycolate hydrolase